MALVLEIKVKPSSGKSALQLDKAGRIVCFLKSAPEKGAANKELIKLLSGLLETPQQAIKIVGGLTQRNKLIKFHTLITQETFFKKTGLCQQLSLEPSPAKP